MAIPTTQRKHGCARKSVQFFKENAIMLGDPGTTEEPGRAGTQNDRVILLFQKVGCLGKVSGLGNGAPQATQVFTSRGLALQ